MNDQRIVTDFVVETIPDDPFAPKRRAWKTPRVIASAAGETRNVNGVAGDTSGSFIANS